MSDPVPESRDPSGHAVAIGWFCFAPEHRKEGHGETRVNHERQNHSAFPHRGSLA